jgi:hypothetical protein
MGDGIDHGPPAIPAGSTGERPRYPGRFNTYIYSGNKGERMMYEGTVPRHLLIILTLLVLALVAPAAAQGAVTRAVQPGETIEVGTEPLILDLVNLRNQDTFNPVTELRHYQSDDTTKKIVRVVGVPNDGYFTINAHTLGGKYGRYFAFSSKDGLIQQHSITFAPAPTVTATESETTATVTTTKTPAETTPETTTAAPTATRASLPGLIAIVAIGICGLFVAVLRR